MHRSKDTGCSPSLDDLVGALLEKPRHVQAERLGSLEVDDQLELNRGLDRKLVWLLALQDAIGISSCTPKIIVHVISIGQQAAEFSEEAGRIDGRETIASRQRYDLRAIGDRERVRRNDQATIWLECQCGNDRF